MANNVKSVLDKHITITLDRRFLMKVLSTLKRFEKKNEEHINFFGGNLIGVYRPRWVEEDRLIWIEDLLDIKDFEGMRDDLHDLEGINSNFLVSSDPINLSFVYMAHKALNAPELNATDRERLAHAVMTMLQYKFLTSIHTHIFKYAADEAISLAVYESLDRKSAIKREGSWAKLIEGRSDDILSDSSIHFKTLRSFDDDEEIVKMLNDIQGRIRAVIGKLRDTFEQVKNAQAKIASTDNFTTVGDDVLLKEQRSKYERIRERMHDMIPSKNVFIKDNLIDAVVKVVPTVSPRQLEECLEYLSVNYKTNKKGKELKQLVEDIVILLLDVVRREKISTDNLPALMFKLRALLRSSRANSAELSSIRERTGDLVEDALRTRSSSNIASTRIGLALYLILRAVIEQ